MRPRRLTRHHWPTGGSAASITCALLLGITHLLITGTCAVLVRKRAGPVFPTDNPLIPAFLVHRIATRPPPSRPVHAQAAQPCLAHHGSGALRLPRRRRPACGPGSAYRRRRYVHRARSPPHRLRCAPGIAMGAIVSIQSPPLIITNMIISAFAAISLSRARWFPSRCRNPVAGAGRLQRRRHTQSSSRAGRKRLNLDAEARKALNFVDEFENSGRGWFWETNAEGTLSYVSQQLADDFRCEAHELLGRQFTDLLSVDTASGATRGAQDARLPPVGALPLLRRDRPRGERRGHPLVAVGQSRSSTSAAASSASAASAPTSPSSAAPSRKLRGSRGSIR